MSKRRDVYQGAEYDTRPTRGRKWRAELEKELANSVRSEIGVARSSEDPSKKLYAAYLLANSLENHGRGWRNSFAVWTARKGRLIGLHRSDRVGQRICEELGFTIQEAREIIAKTPKPANERK